MADHQILIVGGGAAGIATAASLHKRDASLDIAIIEPSATHYYQPGWTMVGAGIFKKRRNGTIHGQCHAFLCDTNKRDRCIVSTRRE
jgi:2-polyprenyl-6-methoxyphenol hydroxylase-like FAD-dependent oxidoreductase